MYDLSTKETLILQALDNQSEWRKFVSHTVEICGGDQITVTSRYDICIPLSWLRVHEPDIESGDSVQVILPFTSSNQELPPFSIELIGPNGTDASMISASEHDSIVHDYLDVTHRTKDCLPTYIFGYSTIPAGLRCTITCIQRRHWPSTRNPLKAMALDVTMPFNDAETTIIQICAPNHDAKIKKPEVSPTFNSNPLDFNSASISGSGTYTCRIYSSDPNRPQFAKVGAKICEPFDTILAYIYLMILNLIAGLVTWGVGDAYLDLTPPKDFNWVDSVALILILFIPVLILTSTYILSQPHSKLSEQLHRPRKILLIFVTLGPWIGILIALIQNNYLF